MSLIGPGLPRIGVQQRWTPIFCLCRFPPDILRLFLDLLSVLGIGTAESRIALLGLATWQDRQFKRLKGLGRADQLIRRKIGK